MEVLRVNNFKGTNTEDENLSPNVLPFALNCDTSKGRLAKRLGYTSLVDLLSTGSPKGLHTAKFSGGDTLLVGADTSAYKLSGTASTEVVTTTAEFNGGTITPSVNNGLEVDSNSLLISNYEDSTIEADETKTFSDAFDNYLFYVRISSQVGSAGDSTARDSNVRINFRDSSNNLIFYILNYRNNYNNNGFFKIYNSGGSELYNTSRPETGNTSDYLKIINNGDSIDFLYNSTSVYQSSNSTLISGLKYINFDCDTDTFGQGYFYDFTIHEYNTSGYQYFSKTFDLGQTPVASSLAYTTTSSGGYTLSAYARGSNDGIRFGDWSIVSSSGSSIPQKRYVEIRLDVSISGTAVSSFSLSDFTISYITSFDTATAFDTGLTGNKIRWVNYQGQQDDGTGTATELKQYVYYCDGTSYKKYDGTTVTDITSSVVAPNIIYEHKGYMFFVPSGDETRLYYSDPYGANAADPLNAFEVTDATYYMQFPAKIKGLRTFQGKLVVSGDDFTSFVNGSIFGGTDDDTVVYQIDDKGVPNHESMAICSTNQGNILALVTRDGLVYLSGSEYENALEQKPLTTTVQSYINECSFTNSYLKYHDGKLYFGFNSGVVPTDYVDSILVFNFRNQLTIDGVWDIGLNDMAVFNNRLYGSSSDTTNILELLSGQSDNGSDIDMKAVIRFNFGNVKTTLERVKIKATTDSDFDNLTSANLIVYNDSHSRNIDLTTGRWRESGTYYSQYKGQDLMESKRSIKKRGTFVEATFDVSSTYKFEIDSLEFEYKGVRQ